VIGGGDFAEDRIIPDLIRGVITGDPVQIRNPKSIRPWQHVLDPLWGYFLVLTALMNGKEIKNINFALNQRNLTVGEVVEIAKKEWDEINVEYGSSKLQGDVTPSESTNLQLSAVLAEEQLKWRPHFDQVEAIASTLNWWRRAIASGVSASGLVELEVIEFLKGKKLE
jgi:CDP-glucose 4,6-dehydratase